MTEYPPITLYTKPVCAGCKLVKDLFEREGVDYEVVDIIENDEAYSYVTNVIGAQTVPVVVSDLADPIIGFKPDALKALIKKTKENDA